MDVEHRVVMEVRHVPRYRLMIALQELGAEMVDVASVIAPRWAAHIESLEPDIVGIVEVPRDRLVIEGVRVEVERVHSYILRQTERYRR
ncbi:MAG TPA: hypothetical protein PKD09_23675 [Aggregatilinea sp.]|jgi:hypothetical protein|uniref:hypothetical protein n=1 Tax=Aggregatilinea sp. TaxID=2806333 RepID=UPI002CC3E148|nr:hypothetical protein [Aggregatilinea sp.]HML24674.1 hypothetical protein [Aggregatilinea sp.]